MIVESENITSIMEAYLEEDIRKQIEDKMELFYDLFTNKRL